MALQRRSAGLDSSAKTTQAAPSAPPAPPAPLAKPSASDADAVRPVECVRQRSAASTKAAVTVQSPRRTLHRAAEDSSHGKDRQPTTMTTASSTPTPAPAPLRAPKRAASHVGVERGKARGPPRKKRRGVLSALPQRGLGWCRFCNKKLRSATASCHKACKQRGGQAVGGIHAARRRQPKQHVEVQRQQEKKRQRQQPAVCGFLRDVGHAVCKRNSWVVGSLSLYK